MRRWAHAVFWFLVVVFLILLYFRKTSERLDTTRSEPSDPSIEPKAAPKQSPAISQPSTAERPRDAGLTDDSPIMQKIRENVKTNPALAVSLAYEARRSFSESRHAEERDALLIDALINIQKIGAARSEAEKYLEQYPNGRYAAHIFAMTGASPRPHGPGR
jgi:hypothetical protein